MTDGATQVTDRGAGCRGDTWHSVPVRYIRALAILLAALVFVAGCSSNGGGPKKSAESVQKRLQEARSQLDKADYLGLTLIGSDLPKDGSVLIKVTGTGTHEPAAFKGTATIRISGQEVKADLIAVGGKVYAKLPFVGWNSLDPKEYGAPDPGALMSTDTGISSFVTSTTDAKASGEERDGKDVLTKVAGTLPGDTIKALFPGAGDGDFTVVYTLTDSNALRQARLTGPFYAGSDKVTYTITFDPDAKKVDIKAP